jgi:hypothetical protein
MQLAPPGAWFRAEDKTVRRIYEACNSRDSPNPASPVDGGRSTGIAAPATLLTADGGAACDEGTGVLFRVPLPMPPITAAAAPGFWNT